MKTFGTIFGVVLGVGLLAVMVVTGYFGVKFTEDLFSVLDPQTAVIMAIASVTAFLCAAMIFRGFALIGQKEAKSHMRLEKAQLYERVLLLWGAKLNSRTISVDQPLDDELQQLAQLLTLRGNPKVIKVYVELHTLEKAVGLHSPDIPLRVATMQMEMRKDLGVSTQNLNAKDLLQLLFDHVHTAPEPGVPQQPQDLQPRVSLAANA